MTTMKHITYGGTGGDYSYMAVIVVRRDVKGARRESHEHYADYKEELNKLVIDYLLEGFSVIRYDLWEVV
jgi:hypothetical protein